ncbi:MAG: 2-amino-4-hydroxy-6-hydroxymethyldihydropteridine diphosphokinase [Actinomycetota bacterium]|nr:2-amino-4-hydroxy-6-hydroxymethyldihydropteridine diphosphokinase [Actinomycetota bacterium]
MPDLNQTIVDTLSGSLRPIRRAALGLGSNLGDSREILQAAVETLLESPELLLVAVSPVYETEPVGGPAQPSYLNAVLVVDTTLSPTHLLDRAHAVEAAFGRERDQRWGPRTLDIDVLAVGDRVLAGEMVLPHPRAHERAFVLVPWSDVDPGFVLPGQATIGELAAAVDRRGVRRREDLALVVS